MEIRSQTFKANARAALVSRGLAELVRLAEALGMETTAEGVETLDELDLVRSLGCSHVQGYIYDKPLSAEQAQELAFGGGEGGVRHHVEQADVQLADVLVRGALGADDLLAFGAKAREGG